MFHPKVRDEHDFSFLKPPTAGIMIFDVDSGMGRASQVGSRQIYLDFDLHFRKLQGSVKGLVEVFV